MASQKKAPWGALFPQREPQRNHKGRKPPQKGFIKKAPWP